MISEKQIERIIREGIMHIKCAQRPGGGFTSLSSFRQDDFSEAVSYSTTFFASVILSCLNSIGKILELSGEVSGDLEEVRKRAAEFLIDEAGSNWSWNYWVRGAKERETMPYPDDLDDTFAALAALRQYDPKLIDGKILASVAKMLTTLEVQEGGPYRTWLVETNAEGEWKDIDIVANSTIAHFLSLMDVHLPNIEHFLDDVIENNHLESPYYPGVCQVAYFVSRNYRGKYRETLADRIRAHLEEHRFEITPLECAMAISSLVNLGFSEKMSDQEITSLSEHVEKEGFRPYAFCIDPSRGGERSCAGASALTAAFCIEALAKYLATARAAGSGSKEIPATSDRAHFAERIKAIAKRECGTAGEHLGKITTEKIDAITDEKIILLAHDFQKALGKRGHLISTKIIERLSLANLYGWLAYTIYDDFLDGENNPLLLPAANLFFRKLTDQYATLDKKIPGTSDLFQSMMDELDEANMWEQIHCRIHGEKIAQLPKFGNYENLASRSIGHALGPLTILLSLGHERGSKEFLATGSFFRHYLIARQLHDDAHDWADDLARGRITSVAALILNQYDPQAHSAPLVENIPELKNLFWTKIIENVVEQITYRIATARHAREEATIIDPSFMEPALLSLELGAKKTLEERDEAVKFLKEYERS